jgi:hypothetical protein
MNEKQFKNLSLAVLIISALIVALAGFFVSLGAYTCSTSVVPGHSITYNFSGWINFVLVAGLGLIPGMFFRVKKRYRASLLTVLLCFISGMLLTCCIRIF